MHQKIDNYIFPSSTVSKMKRAIEKTERDNKEHAFSLCLDEKINEIHTGKEIKQKGETSKVVFDSDCDKYNKKHIGTFHTHTKTDSDDASAMDINNNCKEENKIDCIGSSKDKKIMCMTKINPSEDCQYKVRDLLEEENNLIVKKEGNESTLYMKLDKVIDENFKITELEKY